MCMYLWYSYDKHTCCWKYKHKILQALVSGSLQSNRGNKCVSDGNFSVECKRYTWVCVIMLCCTKGLTLNLTKHMQELNFAPSKNPLKIIIKELNKYKCMWTKWTGEQMTSDKQCQHNCGRLKLERSLEINLRYSFLCSAKCWVEKGRQLGSGLDCYSGSKSGSGIGGRAGMLIVFIKNSEEPRIPFFNLPSQTTIPLPSPTGDVSSGEAQQKGLWNLDITA